MSTTRACSRGLRCACAGRCPESSDVTETSLDLRLARDGGPPARTRPERPMFPGGMELGDEEARGRGARHPQPERLPLLRRRRRAARGRRLRARVRRAHGREARAVRQRRLVGADLRADRGRASAGRRGDRPRVHVERDRRTRSSRRGAVPGARRGRRVADARPRGRRARRSTPTHEGDPARCTCAARRPTWTRSDRDRARARARARRGRLPGGGRDVRAARGSGRSATPARSASSSTRSSRPARAA